jgi:hypothetical protein
MHDSEFPTAPELVTPDWLSDVLGVAVSHAHVERFATGVGVIGQVTRLRLTSPDRSAPASLIAKFAASNPATRALAASYDMYGREHRFYTQLAERFPVRVPRCHYAAYDASDQSFVLLLEDLGNLRLGDQLVGASLDDARRVVGRLAAMHAAFWQGDASDAALAWLPVHANAAQAHGMQQGFDAGWPVIAERFPTAVSGAAAAAAPRLSAAVPGLLRRLCSGALTLAHADVRLDNLFFDGENVAFVDWQSVCLSAPEQDIAYFITQSLTDTVRRSHGHDLLRHYHRALTAHGVPGYAFVDCVERYRLAALYLVCYAVIIAGTLDMGNERGAALGQALLERSLHSLDELDAWRLLDD